MTTASGGSQAAQTTELMQSPATLPASTPASPSLATAEVLDVSPLSSPILAPLPVELDIAVPVHRFKVRNLLALTRGQVVESQWGQGDDLPLAARDVQLAWCEFEVVESRLAVRITRLA